MVSDAYLGVSVDYKALLPHLLGLFVSFLALRARDKIQLYEEIF